MSDHEVEMFLLMRYGNIDRALKEWLNSHVELLVMKDWGDDENRFLFEYLKEKRGHLRKLEDVM